MLMSCPRTVYDRVSFKRKKVGLKGVSRHQVSGPQIRRESITLCPIGWCEAWVTLIFEGMWDKEGESLMA